MQVLRSGFMLIIALILSGCSDHFGVSANIATTSTFPQPPQTAYASWITPRDLYTVIWVEALQPNGNQISGCAQAGFLGAALNARKRTITVAADVAPNVSLPLYAVTQDGSSSCTVRYAQVFLAPRQIIDPGLPFTITGSALVDDTGNQRISEYLQAGASFATLIAPLVPQAGVVAGGINTALQSDAGKALSNEANSLMSSRIEVGGTPLVSMQPSPTPSAWSQMTMTYKINLVRYNYNNTQYNEPPTELGTLVVHILRTSTIIGSDPVTDKGMINSGPSYDNLSGQTKVFNFVSGPAGISAQSSYLLTLLNESAGVVTAVSSLSSSATPQQVTEACGHLRNGIQSLGFLNTLDSTAYLWWAYSQSAYANAHETPASLTTTLSPCLTPQEQSVVLSLGIGNWPHRYSS